MHLLKGEIWIQRNIEGKQYEGRLGRRKPCAKTRNIKYYQKRLEFANISKEPPQEP